VKRERRSQCSSSRHKKLHAKRKTEMLHECRYRRTHKDTRRLLTFVACPVQTPRARTCCCRRVCLLDYAEIESRAREFQDFNTRRQILRERRFRAKQRFQQDGRFSSSSVITSVQNSKLDPNTPDGRTDGRTPRTPGQVFRYCA